MKKKEQILETSEWLDELYESCMIVIETTDVSLIGPYELVNLVNTRLFMEKLSRDNETKKTSVNIGKPNLVVLNPKDKPNDKN